MTLYLGMDQELLVVDPDHPKDATAILQGTRIAALTVNPREPDRLFVGTYSEGLLRSVDAGGSWTRIGTDVKGSDVIAQMNVLSVAVSPTSTNVVFAGTEPSALYRSDDGGDSWHEMTEFQNIPSKPSWSFPPKPETHHVRWITPHPSDEGRVFVAVEAGALVQSANGGETWEDRVHGSPYDSHTVLIHPDQPDRLLSAAGDGFFEGEDRGQSWRKRETGLPWRYCYGLAVDAVDSDLTLMSVSPGAHRGHGRRSNAQATIVRRRGDGDWEILSNGLPDPEGTTLSMLAADPNTLGRFYALNNTGVYRTEDEGTTWQRLDVPWKEGYLDRRPATIAISGA